MGKIVETIWAPIMGFAFIFYRRGGTTIGGKELGLLFWLSRLTLLLGILYLLMVPLLVVNTIRIHELNRARLIAQFENNDNQIQQVQEQLDSVSEEELTARFPNSNKEDLLAQLKQDQNNVEEQAQSADKEQQLNLINLTVKWGLGAILGATSLILIWRYTSWARKG